MSTSTLRGAIRGGLCEGPSGSSTPLLRDGASPPIERMFWYAGTTRVAGASPRECGDEVGVGPTAGLENRNSEFWFFIITILINQLGRFQQHTFCLRPPHTFLTSPLQARGQANAPHAHTMQYSRVCVGRARPATFNKRGKSISAPSTRPEGQSETKEEHSGQPRVVLKIGRRLGVGAYGS